jgi:hypothetical protein
MLPVPPAPENEIQFACTECGQPIRVPVTMAGQPCECPRCRKWVEIPRADAAGPAGSPTSYRRDDLYGLPQHGQPGYGYGDFRREPPPQEGGMGAAAGWIIFILIFGVGNLILYATTGIFLIPIPRR